MPLDSVLKRFTYDWLIRFAELHPFEIYDYNANGYDWLPSGPRNPLHSKYAAISPRFTTIITRYMPYIFYSKYVNVENGTIKEDALPLHNKTKVYACDTVKFSKLNPGILSVFQDKRVTFYFSKTFWIFESANSKNTYTSNEFKYVLKFCPFGEIFYGFGAFDKPTMLSEIWPLLTHYKEISLYIKNLIYDDNIGIAFCQSKTFPIKLSWCNVNISDKTMLEMFDYFMSVPQRSLDLRLTFQQPKSPSLFQTVVEKFVSAGNRVTHCVKPEIPFNQVIVYLKKRKLRIVGNLNLEPHFSGIQ
uniref:F-box domain-containing protein n=1 Tax=Panagrellus redivivus TaxID=6233 RepID=A0A7E4ZY73_PANRE